MTAARFAELPGAAQRALALYATFRGVLAFPEEQAMIGNATVRQRPPGPGQTTLVVTIAPDGDHYRPAFCAVAGDVDLAWFKSAQTTLVAAWNALGMHEREDLRRELVPADMLSAIVMDLLSRGVVAPALFASFNPDPSEVH